MDVDSSQLEAALEGPTTTRLCVNEVNVKCSAQRRVRTRWVSIPELHPLMNILQKIPNQNSGLNLMRIQDASEMKLL
jgi:hypothetical protein